MNKEATPSRDADIGALLELAGIRMQLLLIVYVVTFVTLATTSGSTRTWQGIVALAITICAATVVVLPGTYPLSGFRVVPVVGAAAAVTILVLGQLVPVGAPGYAAWNFGATTFMFFALALWGRIGWAWVGMGLVVALTGVWSWVTTGTPAHGIEIVYGQVGSLFAGTFFAVLLRRTASDILEFQAIQRRLVREEQMIHDSARERERALAQLTAQVLEPLQAIASGNVSDLQRNEHGLLEAALRDSIRGKRLQLEPLTAAVEAARRRGLYVVLLDDCGTTETPAGIAEHGATWAAERVARARTGPITIRLSADGDGILISAAAANATPEFLRFSSPAR